MNLLAALAVGRLVVWLAQTNGLTRRFWSLRPILAELGECDLCIGCWILPFVAWLFSVNLLAPVYVPVLSEVLTGWMMAFALHIGRLGWESKFGTIELRG